ncbi:hypothetical protein ACWEF6_01800 [Amycolatopsis sp. NPDC004772]
MGMYTALVLDARLKRDVPERVLLTLRHMVGELETLESTPDHALFGDTRWEWMLRGNSAYFPVERPPKLYRPFYGSGEGAWLLSVGCSIKNYDREIPLFLEWLTPYVEEAIGYTMYEEDETITPVLLGDYFGRG